MSHEVVQQQNRRLLGVLVLVMVAVVSGGDESDDLPLMAGADSATVWRSKTMAGDPGRYCA